MLENKKERIITDEQYERLRQTLNRANGVFLVLGSGFKMDESYLTYQEDDELDGLHSCDLPTQIHAWKQVWLKSNRLETHPFLIAYPAWMKTSPLPPNVQPKFHVFKSSVMDCVSGLTGSNINLFELNGNIGIGLSDVLNVEKRVETIADIDKLIPLFPYIEDQYQCRKKTVSKFETILEDLSVSNVIFLGCSSQSEIHASFFNRSLNKSRIDRVNIVTANNNKDNFMIEHSTVGVCCDAKAFLDDLHDRLINDHPELPDSYGAICKKIGLC